MAITESRYYRIYPPSNPTVETLAAKFVSNGGLYYVIWRRSEKRFVVDFDVLGNYLLDASDIRIEEIDRRSAISLAQHLGGNLLDAEELVVPADVGNTQRS